MTSLQEGAVVPSAISSIPASPLVFPVVVAAIGSRGGLPAALVAATREAGAATGPLGAAAALLEEVVALRHARLPLLLAQPLDLLPRHGVLQQALVLKLPEEFC